jgi:DNA polymerase-1
MTKYIILDVEANGFLPEVDTVWQVSVKTAGVDGVRSYPKTTIRMDAQVQAEVDDADYVIMHNGIGYDVPVLEKCLGVIVPRTKLIDTLVLSRLGKPERTIGHSLAAWGEMLNHPKVEHAEWDKWSPEMQIRCDEDVLLNEKVWDKLKGMLDVMPVAVNSEMLTAWACADMNRCGVHFRTDKALKLLDTLMEESAGYYNEAEAFMPSLYFPKGKVKSLKRAPNKAHWACGQLDAGIEFQEVTKKKLSPGSRDDISLFLKRKYGWVSPQKTPTGKPKINDEILRALPWPEAETFASYLKTEKLIGYINGPINKKGNGGGWLQHVTPEGKLHGNFISLTAVTGRPSCVAPNLQQVSTDPRARELFIPRAGWKLVGVDADGQELRVFGHYLAPFDGGIYGREVVDGDIHTKVQHLIGFSSRKITKNVEYSMLYGAGNPRLGLYAIKDALDAGLVPPTNTGKRGKEMRAAIMQGIVGYADLLDAVQEKARLTGRLKGLDGRTLWVRKVYSALNLLFQSAGIIHMKKAIALLRPALEDAGFKYDRDWAMPLWVHDEIQLETRPEVAEDIGKIGAWCIEEAARQLKIRVPMTGTYDIGDNWKETH